MKKEHYFSSYRNKIIIREYSEPYTNKIDYLDVVNKFIKKQKLLSLKQERMENYNKTMPQFVELP